MACSSLEIPPKNVSTFFYVLAMLKVSFHLVDFPRIPEPAPRSACPSSDIELMLQEYRRAREEAKVEIAQARDRLKERTEQEKKRIRQQIISQLLKVGNETVLCLRTVLEPGPDLRFWRPSICLFVSLVVHLKV